MTNHIATAVTYAFIALTWLVLGLSSKRDVRLYATGLFNKDPKGAKRSRNVARFFFIGAGVWGVVFVALLVIALVFKY